MKLSTEEFDELVVEALCGIPQPFRSHLKDIAVETESMPDQQTCRAAGVKDPRSLFGLYRGIPLTERSVEHPRRPDRITIYQRNIERICLTRDEVIREVRKTVLHEVGHHFGLDESELGDLGYA